MAVNLLYFAWVREKIGCDSEAVTPPAGVETIGDLVAWLAERGGGYGAALSDPSALRAARDQEFCSLDTAIGDAGEIAIFPPVTGG